MNTLANQDSLYLPVDQVAERYGVSTDSIWRGKRQGDFPKAVAIGPNCTRWRLSDLIAQEDPSKACLADGMFAA